MDDQGSTELLKCICGVLLPVTQLCEHIRSDHVSKFWRCGCCTYSSSKLNLVLIHCLQQRHNPTEIFSPSLPRFLHFAQRMFQCAELPDTTTEELASVSQRIPPMKRARILRRHRSSISKKSEENRSNIVDSPESEVVVAPIPRLGQKDPSRIISIPRERFYSTRATSAKVDTVSTSGSILRRRHFTHEMLKNDDGEQLALEENVSVEAASKLPSVLKRSKQTTKAAKKHADNSGCTKASSVAKLIEDPLPEQLFGEATFIWTQHGNQLLVADNPENPDEKFLFYMQKMSGVNSLWQCKSCAKLRNRCGKAKVALIAVRDGMIARNPSLGHCEQCQPYSTEDVVVLSEMRELYNEVERTGKSPREAHAQMMATLSQRCKEARADYLLTMQKMPRLEQMERTMRRRRQRGRRSMAEEQVDGQTEWQMMDVGQQEEQTQLGDSCEADQDLISS